MLFETDAAPVPAEGDRVKDRVTRCPLPLPAPERVRVNAGVGSHPPTDPSCRVESRARGSSLGSGTRVMDPD